MERADLDPETRKKHRKTLYRTDSSMRRTAAAAKPSTVHSTTSASYQFPSHRSDLSHFVWQGSTARPDSTSDHFDWVSSYHRSISHTHPTIPGLYGLTNFGNTCYMNSALQCICNTQPLTEYFIGSEKGEKMFKKHINESNRMGSGGMVANAYSDLLDDMLGGYITPQSLRLFRTVFCRFAPQFDGHAQQDSQEMMAFLLDILHEDLNQVKKKPYLSAAVESEGRTDKVIAKESWDRHLRRNDSVIVRLFQGQLKAKTECSQCDKVFTAFDPFMFLTLPVPNETRNMLVAVVQADPSKEISSYQVAVPMNGTVENLKTELSKLTHSEADRMVIASVHKGLFQHVYDGKMHLSRVWDKNIFVYELTHSRDPFWRFVPVCHKETDQFRPQYVPQSHRSCDSQCCGYFGIPMVVAVHESQLNEAHLYEVILSRYRRYVKTATSSRMRLPPCPFKICTLKFGTMNPGMKRDEFSSAAVKDLLQGMDLHNLIGCPKVYIGCCWTPTMKKSCYESSAEHIKDPPQCCPVIGQRNLHLTDCLKLSLERQILNNGQAWFCLNCKKLVEASRTYELWKLPQILMVHFKRFSNDRTHKFKLDKLIEFPVRSLDLSEYVKNSDDPKPIYDLYAICNHKGTVYGGHYTAFCKNKNTDKWYKLDDTHVSQICEGQLETAAAYVLFYHRRTEEKSERSTVTSTIGIRKH